MSHRWNIRSSGWPRFNNPITLALQGAFLPKPILRHRPKHTQQGQKETEKYFQKGLVTNRNKPGLFTHHFNTAAIYNRLKSVHTTKWEKVPKCNGFGKRTY